MSEQRTQLEHLSVELFRLIFEYLAPHELFQAFDQLNSRVTAILARQPLCLPNNRQMPCELYLDYLEKISDYASQLVYLHLSERYAPHAVEELLSEVDGESVTLPALKAAIIQDLPPDTFINLLVESSLLTQVRSLTVDLSDDCYHHSDYVSSIDMDYLLPVLNHLPNLCSLSVRISPWFDDGYIDELKSFVPSIKTHYQLHTLSIDACSRQLFVELLGGGYLPKLRRLNVVFSRAEFYSFKTKCASTISSSPAVPFEQSSIPELRSVSVVLHDDVAGILTYFEKIQREGQLETLEISGYANLSKNGKMPRVKALRHWLTISRSARFTFEMHLLLASDDQQRLKTILTEYRRVTGSAATKLHGRIDILYPRMSLIRPMESDDEGSSDESMDEWLEYVFSPYIDQLDLEKETVANDKWLEGMKAVARWPYLRKITLHGGCMGESNTFNVAIALLLHIAQRSPRFRQLKIEGEYLQDGPAEFCFGPLLASNRELGILLVSQLEELHFDGEHLNCSLVDLAQTFDQLFAHSASSPVLKTLILDVGAHPRSWLNTPDLLRGTRLLFHRFPSLIHFTLNCSPYDAYSGTIYDFSYLAMEWYVNWRSSQPEKDACRTLSYRDRPNSLDVWL